MDENFSYCLTCLSGDRFLYPAEGFQWLFFEINIELRRMNGGICWECQRVMEKFLKFKAQVQHAQEILDNNRHDQLRPLTKLSTYKKTSYDDFYYDPQYMSTSSTCTNTDSTESNATIIYEEHNYVRVPTEKAKGSVNLNYSCAELIPGLEIEDASDELLTEISDLPKITFVESIFEHPKRVHEGSSDIIELNIPVTFPLNLHTATENRVQATTQKKDTIYQRRIIRDTNGRFKKGTIKTGLAKRSYVEPSIVAETQREYSITNNVKDNVDNKTQQKEKPNEVQVKTKNTERIEEAAAKKIMEAVLETTTKELSKKREEECVRIEQKQSEELQSISNEIQSLKESIEKDLEKQRTEQCGEDARICNDNVVIKKEIIEDEPANASFEEAILDLESLVRDVKEEPVSDHEEVDDLIILNHEEHNRACTQQPHETVNIISPNPLQAVSSILDSETKVKIEMDDDVRDYQLWKRSVMLIYSRLRSHKYASTFLNPVSDVIAPEYSQVVKRPMDLNTIRRNVRNGVIRTTSEFQRNVLLMIMNALMYNSVEHTVYNMATEFFREAEYHLNLLLTVNHSPIPDSTPSQRTRRRLQNNEDTPPAKIPRLIIPKLENNTPKAKKITPKVERMSMAAPKAKKITPKVERKSIAAPKPKKITPKVERKSIAAPKAKKITPKVERKSIAAPKTKKITPKVERMSIFTPNVENVASVSAQVENSPIMPNKSKVLPKVTDNPVTPKVVGLPTVSPKVEKVEPKVEKRVRKPNKKYCLDYIESSDVDIYIDETVDNEVYNDDFCVAITTETYVELLRDQASMIKKTLEEKILSMALDLNNFAPRFRGKPIIADGVVKLWCENKKTLIWLSRVVAELPGKLIVRRQAELPRKLKSAILVPTTDNTQVIQKLLKAQNPWAAVETWVLYSAEQRGENTFLVLGIPSTVIPNLLSRGRRLAYSLGSVFVRFYNSNGRLADEP